MCESPHPTASAVTSASQINTKRFVSILRLPVLRTAREECLTRIGSCKEGAPLARRTAVPTLTIVNPAEATLEARCARCGTHITTSGDRVFPFGESSVLCFDCAMACGGVHDEDADTWTTTPDLSGLLAIERDP